MKPYVSATLFSALLAVPFLFTGCGPSEKSIAQYEARLQSFETKGVPDSLLSSVRVYLSQVKGGKESHNMTVVSSSMDSVKFYIAAAEKWYKAAVETAKPKVDSLVAYFRAKMQNLSGLQKKVADSMMAIVDDLSKKEWFTQALTAANDLDTVMMSLVKDEASAKKASASIVGTWTKNKKLTDDGANAVEKTRVTFKKDGTFAMEESMKGQTKPNLKEDWQFTSSGTYGIKGDTILLSVQKEKRLREVYWNLIEKKGKRSWMKTEKKPYDTVLTNGSKDRFFTFSYLKEDFKK